MKRLVGFLLVVALLLGMSLSHLVLADGGGPPTRVTVCHIISSNTLPNGDTITIGHVISLPDNDGESVEHHLEHGDFIIDAEPHGCCVFCVTKDGDSCPIRPID